MAETRDYDFVVAPVGDDYRRAVKVGTNLAAAVGMIVELDRHAELLAVLEPHLLESQSVLEYPGSTVSTPVTRNLYRAGAEVADILIAAACDFSEWTMPGLPASLHFLRADGSVLLTSIEGEDEVWVSLDEREHARWVQDNGSTLVTRADGEMSLTGWAQWIAPRLATLSSVGRDIPWYLPDGLHSTRAVVDEFLALSDRFAVERVEHGLLLEIPDVTRVAEIDGARFEAGSSGPNVTIIRADDYLYEFDEAREIELVESGWRGDADVSVYSDRRSWGTSLWFVRAPAGMALDLPVTEWWLV